MSDVKDIIQKIYFCDYFYHCFFITSFKRHDWEVKCNYHCSCIIFLCFDSYCPDLAGRQKYHFLGENGYWYWLLWCVILVPDTTDAILLWYTLDISFFFAENIDKLINFPKLRVVSKLQYLLIPNRYLKKYISLQRLQSLLGFSSRGTQLHFPFH